MKVTPIILLPSLERIPVFCGQLAISFTVLHITSVTINLEFSDKYKKRVENSTFLRVPFSIIYWRTHTRTVIHPQTYKVNICVP